MKKGKLLHPEVAKIIASIGHKQFITLADAGLPIPENLARVDLAITQGVPSFMTVLETVTSEMQVEKIILAEEIKLVEPLYQKILNYLADLSKLKKYIDIDYINHDSFKELTSKSRAIIRTGEVTPYANIILISGVTF